ncbi:hypothetical protein COC42_09260 [Sphingomonas spermidinifaciens]|uniref:Uncharacterized protein n=1 Tax=Sphingomonas spermidinifaciens TaxID=1141889 RepID=A0A2A4B937_9SPHN|nr:hypothetical protein COC42_09260 [Sphingomonas spermidinifaciens]
MLHGSAQTFVDVLDYEGSQPFSDELVYLVDPVRGRALPLSPLYLWGLEREALDPGAVDMYEYDTERRGDFNFKTTQPSEGLQVSSGGEWSGLHAQLAAMRASDQRCAVVEGLSLTQYESQSAARNSCLSASQCQPCVSRQRAFMQ